MFDSSTKVSSARRIVIRQDVHGLANFGSMTLGLVMNGPTPRKFVARIYGEVIGPFPTIRDAQTGAVDFWREHLSKESLEKRFTDTTRGGFPVRFHHQTGRVKGASIVAAVRYEPGKWAATSFSLTGECQLSDQSDWDLIPRQ